MDDTQRLDWLTAGRLTDLKRHCYTHPECRSVRDAIDTLIEADARGQRKAVRPQSDKMVRARDDK